LKTGFNDAIAKVGLVKFVSDLFWVGMFYHLYNQVNPSFSMHESKFWMKNYLEVEKLKKMMENITLNIRVFERTDFSFNNLDFRLLRAFISIFCTKMLLQLIYFGLFF